MNRADYRGQLKKLALRYYDPETGLEESADPDPEEDYVMYRAYAKLEWSFRWDSGAAGGSMGIFNWCLYLDPVPGERFFNFREAKKMHYETVPWLGLSPSPQMFGEFINETYGTGEAELNRQVYKQIRFPMMFDYPVVASDFEVTAENIKTSEAQQALREGLIASDLMKKIRSMFTGSIANINDKYKLINHTRLDDDDWFPYKWVSLKVEETIDVDHEE